MAATATGRPAAGDRSSRMFAATPPASAGRRCPSGRDSRRRRCPPGPPVRRHRPPDLDDHPRPRRHRYALSVDRHGGRDIRELAGIANEMTAHGEETRSLLDGLSAAGAQERGVSAKRPAASRRRWRSTGRIFWSLGRRGATPPPPPAGDRAGRGRAVLPAARHPAGAAIPGHPPSRSVRRVEGPHPVTLRPHHRRLCDGSAADEYGDRMHTVRAQTVTWP